MVAQSHERHTVQVYETDDFLSRRVVDYLSAGLAAKDACVVIATESHLAAFSEGLLRAGHDLPKALACQQLVMLDARETLNGFMLGDTPDGDRFDEIVGATIANATKRGPRVRAFGEMVDVLWRDGKPDAALQLEQLWNGLAHSYDFDLLCAYTISSFYKTTTSKFREVCAVHEHVHAPEPGEITEANEHIRALVDEVGRRAEVERELRRTIRMLDDARESERVRTARAGQLQQATAMLATAVSVGEVSDTIMNAAAQLAGGAAAAVYFADADGKFRLHGAHHVNPAERWSLLSLDAPRPVARAIAAKQPIYLESREQLLVEFPALETLPLDRTQSVAAFPLLRNGAAIGGLGISFATPRTFSEDERGWLEAFATQCAFAIERARLYAAEQKARGEAETLLRIAESLNDMHLDLESILQKVTDEAKALVGAEFGAFHYNVTDERGESHATYTLSGTRTKDISQISQSYLEVPIRSRTGKVIGGLSVGHSEPAKLTTQHEHWLRTLAPTAAIAIDNAELYRAARDAEDAQRKTVQQLVDTIRVNELFTGVLAHDLRSPLAAITTAAEVLLMKGLEPRTAERVLSSATRMARMIEQILDFTRIRLGTGVPLDTKPCDLEQVLSHVVEEARSAQRAQPIRVEKLGDTRGRWDDDRLAQAFSNVIGNAAQYGTPERGVDVRIDGTDERRVRVTIHNAGAIPEEVLPRIFEPLFSTGQRRRDGSRGLGLGLFITKEIAASHGGSIDLESTQEAGTTFTLVLPRDVAPTESQEPVARRDHTIHSENVMRTLVESVRDCAIFMLDDNARVLTWSPACERITGWREDIVGKPFSQLYPPEGHEQLEIELSRAAKLGVTERVAWATRRDGTQLWADVSLSAVRSTSGDLSGYAVVMRDRSEWQAAHKELEENARNMRLMADSVRDYAIFMLDVDGHVQTWSRGAQLIKGYTPGEIIGKHIAAFYTREDRDAQRPQALLAKAIADGRVEDEGWRVRKDGSRFWADVVITAARDENADLRGFVKVTRDLTDRRLAEEELRRSEERFRLMVESVKDYAIFLLDPTGHIMTWNAGAERNKGYAAHEIVGQHFSKFYDPREVRAGKCERELEIAAREGRFEEEGWRLRKDGSRFWASVVITPMRGPNGQLVGYAKVTRDLSERKKLEEERVRTIQAQEGIRLRDEFLSIVSHELKTPLAGLLLQIEAITHRGSLDEGARRKLERAREGGERLDQLIETLLDVSRIATGRFVLSRERFDFVSLVKEIVESFQMSAQRVGCSIGVHANEKVVGSWDHVRMSQVIANLLSNAIKYGAGHPIEVRVERANGDVVLEIEDRGPGIDPVMRSKIFERFERAGSTRHHGGLGIGLYVVREIVTAHGGTATVEDSPEGGARFIIRVPVESE